MNLAVCVQFDRVLWNLPFLWETTSIFFLVHKVMTWFCKKPSFYVGNFEIQGFVHQRHINWKDRKVDLIGKFQISQFRQSLNFGGSNSIYFYLSNFYPFLEGVSISWSFFNFLVLFQFPNPFSICWSFFNFLVLFQFLGPSSILVPRLFFPPLSTELPFYGCGVQSLLQWLVSKVVSLRGRWNWDESR